MTESRTNRTASAGRLLRKAVGTVATGVVGVVVVRAAERGEGGSLPRRIAVTTTRLGILGIRRAETAVERGRLAAGDVRAQAYADLGEQAPPPADRSTGGHDHSH
jgi:chaperone-like protein